VTSSSSSPPGNDCEQDLFPWNRVRADACRSRTSETLRFTRRRIELLNRLIRKLDAAQNERLVSAGTNPRLKPESSPSGQNIASMADRLERVKCSVLMSSRPRYIVPSGKSGTSRESRRRPAIQSHGQDIPQRTLPSADQNEGPERCAPRKGKTSSRYCQTLTIG